MPMLTMLRIGRPVCPSHLPARTFSANSPMRSSTSCTAGTTSTPSTVIDVPRGARRATCSTARFSVMLIFSPPNMAAMRSASPDSSASCSSRRSVSSVTRFFE